MSTTKGLNEIKLPRVSRADDMFARQSEEVNNNRLNQNFRVILTAIINLEDIAEGIDDRIAAAIPAMANRVTEVGTDGIWTWRKWSDGRIEAWLTSISASLNCTTASGSMYVAEHTISLPTSLFASIDSVSATPINSTNYIAASVKSISASSLVLRVMCTVSATVGVQFGVTIIGK